MFYSYFHDFSCNYLYKNKCELGSNWKWGKGSKPTWYIDGSLLSQVNQTFLNIISYVMLRTSRNPVGLFALQVLWIFAAAADPLLNGYPGQTTYVFR